MRVCSLRAYCLVFVLTTACGYNPTTRNDAEPDAASQPGAIADVGAGTENQPVLDATLAPDTNRIIGGAVDTGDASTGTGGTGGMGGIVGDAGVATGGTTGSTGAGGAVVTPDAGPKPDANPADAPITCPPPVAPPNGQVDPKSLNVGGQAIYTCAEGYSRPSPESRTCQADGTWSGTAPTCAPVDCGKLEDPKNGKVQALTTTFKSEAVYSCAPNHALQNGDEKRTCQSKGTWSGTAPTCQCVQTMCNGSCVDLTSDNANCGDCSKVCSAVSPSTAECTPTGCLITLVRGTSQNLPAVDSTNVYWSEAETSTVKSIPIRGGAITVLADNQPAPSPPVLAVGKLFWAVGSPINIVTMPIAGGLPTPLANGVNLNGELVANATDLFYLGSSGIVRIPLAGGASSVVPATSGSLTEALALDSANLYWVVDVSTSVARIMKLPLAGGGDPTTLVTATKIKSIAVDATHVYWTEPEDSEKKGRVRKAPLAGGEMTVLASTLDGPSEIAADGSFVYWIGNFGGQVIRLPVAGGTPIPLTSNRWLATGLRIDATSVYWTEYRNDTSQRTAAITRLILK
jgi:hypothetical protein